ncbi:SNG1 family protein Ecym_2017 [Eremothecium cymbalariae DBVPG|uniref:DUF3533 domain-containing protein n=1 Tax=Eremothecium cymbalariae (strain CBS 270.75 / DBVPG 7215 / KCTC 17166 / NRRL Y-17582) TaxID=931890 RepID=G8JNX6_ERECY|nr:Hypothetical protein Ecym_2017 [Eremothecium cymbalariae DBVPG\
MADKDSTEYVQKGSPLEPNVVGQEQFKIAGTGFSSPSGETLWMRVIYNALILLVVCLAIIAFFWGALYDSEGKLGNINISVLIQDEGDIGTNLGNLVKEVPGHWLVHGSPSEFRDYYHLSADADIDAAVHNLVHKGDVWMVLNVKPGATAALTNSLVNTSAPVFNSSEYFEVFYESGRDITGFKASILPIMLKLEKKFEFYYNANYLPSLLGSMSDRIELPSNSYNLAMAGRMDWQQVDYRPFDNIILLGPLQIGLIYIILLTFFQLTLFGPIYKQLIARYQPYRVMLYRYMMSWALYGLLALCFNAMSAIYKIDFTRAYGKVGFLVSWLTTWLCMVAIGGANENIISLISAFQPRFIGLWLMSWIIINISPTFFNMDLQSRFYRYGYFTPIFNTKECLKVIFLDLDQDYLPKAYGILLAWCVVNSILFPFVLKVLQVKSRKSM